MRCKTCDYALWNIRTRQCPECGSPFKPGDYEFVANGVKFCCPHCDQQYYGTGAQGHLIPASFECVRCSRQLSMDDMVLRPAEGVAEAQTMVNPLPWLERQRLGAVKAWFMTVFRSMVAPGDLIKGLDIGRGSGSAWMYALVTSLVISLTGVALPFAAIGLIMAIDDSNDAMPALITAAVVGLFGPIAVLLFTLIWGLTTHGILKVTGGSAHSIHRTYQALLYSMGANVFSIVPCLGPYCLSWVGAIWWAVSAILMLIPAQDVRGGRATLAVLAFPATLCVLGATGYAVLIATILVSGPARFSTTTSNSPVWTNQTEATIVTKALSDSVQRTGKWPDHSLRLVTEGGLLATDFVTSSTATVHTDVPVGDGTLDDFLQLAPGRQTLAAQSAADALPPNVIAHRVGDFVFTYHGIPAKYADSQLWIVILSPDPDSNPSDSSYVPHLVGDANGTVQSITMPWSQALEAQNAVRKAYGLPPLPDPNTVTHDSPAIAESSVNP